MLFRSVISSNSLLSIGFEDNWDGGFDIVANCTEVVTNNPGNGYDSSNYYLTQTATDAATKTVQYNSTFTLVTGKSYSVTARVKDGSVSGQTVALDIYSPTIGSTMGASIVTDATWQLASNPLVAIPSGASDFTIILTWIDATPAGTILWDNFSVIELP